MRYRKVPTPLLDWKFFEAWPPAFGGVGPVGVALPTSTHSSRSSGPKEAHLSFSTPERCESCGRPWR